jgi:membrane-associated protease RseP (regulator of RpoE activity)
VSSNPPEFRPVRSSWERAADYLDPQLKEPGPSSREWAVSAVLLVVTILSTTLAGLFYVAGNIEFFQVFQAVVRQPNLIVYGLPFSIPLITILLAHELGHFIACRYYGMRCTPPYFIPLPILLTGTLGAFIKIKSPFRHKRALFDIGVAGPLAGFILTLPTLWIGIRYSKLVPKGSLGHGGLSFGEPLIFRFIGQLASDYLPSKHDMIAHPMAMAGWVGLLATSLNLLPIWQLDGGHIAYAVLGRERQRRLSIFTLGLLILLSFWGWPTPSYLVFGLLLLIICIRTRFYHPPTLFDEDELGPGRLFIGLLALFILILSFIIVPVTIV